MKSHKSVIYIWKFVVLDNTPRWLFASLSAKKLCLFQKPKLDGCESSVIYIFMKKYVFGKYICFVQTLACGLTEKFDIIQIDRKPTCAACKQQREDQPAHLICRLLFAV